MTDHDDPLRRLYAARRLRDQEALLRVFGDPEAEQLLGAAVNDYLASPEARQDDTAEAEQLLAAAVTEMQEMEGTNGDNHEDPGPDAA